MMDKKDLDKFGRTVRGNAGEPETGRGRPSPALIAFGIVLAAVLIFFFRNSQKAELDFLFFTSHNKTRWLVIVCVVLGVLLDRMFTIWWRHRKKAKLQAKAASM